ncbi:MAG TPA: hypothetical protein VM661_10000 [Candidatus Sulfotelmatobacter sp.]|nr:hypothetical protein [Candidatus Sulfotelmatobacter sp.]
MEQTERHRLPHRRPVVTRKLTAFGKTLIASAGFDVETGKVMEVFFAGGKEGTNVDTIMADVAVVISVALQHGVPVEALAKSIARVPAGTIAPKDIDHAPTETENASPVGDVLDWIIGLDAEYAGIKPATTAAE